MGVGWTKTLGWVTSRRKLAATMGRILQLAPWLHAAKPRNSQLRATAWCGWSLRDAATSTLTSGVIVGGLQHRLIAQRIDPPHQPAFATIHRNPGRPGYRRHA